MVGVVTLGSHWSNLLIREGAMLSSDKFAWGFVQSDPENFQKQRFASYSIQPVLMPASPHYEKMSPCVKLEPPMFYSLGLWSARYIWSYFSMSLLWK